MERHAQETSPRPGQAAWSSAGDARSATRRTLGQKLRRVGIKWNLFLSFVLFSVIMLVLLWLFQVVFLDDFYRAIKTRSLNSASDVIVKNIGSSSLDTLFTWIRQDEEISVRLVDTDGRDVYASEDLPGNSLIRLQAADLATMRERALAAGGSYTDILSRTFDRVRTAPGGFIDRQAPRDLAPQQILVSVRAVTLGDGRKATLLLNTVLTPVNSTISTLRTQLLAITLIMILLSLGLALLLSRRVAGPLVRINNRAKELALGNYEVRFDVRRGYREVQELADTLNQAAHDLNQVEGLRRDLIANVSHDLRTPLTMIGGFAEVMRDLPGENSPENAQVIIDETRRLSSLVSDLLDLSRLQSDKQQMNLQTYSLTTSIRQLIDRYGRLISQEGCDLTFEADRDVMVSGDPQRIEQVLYNLIGNAVTNVGPDKRIIVRQIVADGRVRVEVTDHGDGIPADQLPLIWERYYRSERNHRRPVVGTGLGLSIVRSILLRHSADFGVESTEGQGSTFWFSLLAADV